MKWFFSRNFWGQKGEACYINILSDEREKPTVKNMQQGSLSDLTEKLKLYRQANAKRI